MVYQGSKAKLAKDIVPIIQKYIDSYHIDNYLEPFVGGANVIDKIHARHKIGCDINPYLIALLNYMKDDPRLLEAPEDCDFEHYKSVRNEYNKRKKGEYYIYNDWYLGLIGYCASYGGRFFDGGYGRDKTGKRNIYKERLKVIKEQAVQSKFYETVFKELSYEEITPDNVQDTVIYCDPPYRNTKTYVGNNSFDYDKFYDWCRAMSKKNIMIISEYWMPDDFKCIWQKERKILQKSDRKNGDLAVEKLYIMSDIIA